METGAAATSLLGELFFGRRVSPYKELFPIWEIVHKCLAKKGSSM